MIRTYFERPLLLIAIGFVFLAAGAMMPKVLYFQIPMAIGSAVFFVLALIFVIKQEKPITGFE